MTALQYRFTYCLDLANERRKNWLFFNSIPLHASLQTQLQIIKKRSDKVISNQIISCLFHLPFHADTEQNGFWGFDNIYISRKQH